MKFTVKHLEHGRISFGRVDFFIQGLIILSLISFALETLPNLPKGFYTVFKVIEIVTVIIFSIEYVLRVFLSKQKLSYIFSFLGIIDLLAILPFYINTGLDLRSLRVIRLLRLFRLFKLIRYSKAIQLYHRALVIAKEELVLFAVTASILLYLSSVGIYYFENNAQPDKFTSIFHSFWWSFTALATVGDADLNPVTGGGKVFSIIIKFIGLCLIAVPTGLFAAALTEARDEYHQSLSGDLESDT